MATNARTKRRSFPALAALAAVTAFGLAAPFPVAAVPFSSDILIDIEASFDDFFAFIDGDAIVDGAFGVVEGGAPTESIIFDDTVIGDNPLFGTLTDVGDGFFLEGFADAFAFGEYGVGVDAFIGIENTSPHKHKVTFGVDVLALVDADGDPTLPDDVFASSFFTVFSDAGLEVSSDIASDIPFGDILDGFALGTFGEPVFDSSTTFFDVIVPEGSFALVDGAWTFTGGAFTDGTFAAGAFAASITIEDVARVPEPSMLLLVGAGLVALRRVRRRG